MDEYSYSFVIMVKGMNTLVDSLILERKGTFKNKWVKHIDEFDVYGTIINRKLYESDEKSGTSIFFTAVQKKGMRGHCSPENYGK